MSWPTRTWTADGWKDFKSPLADRRPEGFPAGWENPHLIGEVERNSDHNATFWDIIDNPLYEVAANASGIDWHAFVTESLAQVGSPEDYAAALDYVNDQNDYDNLTPEQQAIVNHFPESEPTQTAQSFGPNSTYPRGGYHNVQQEIRTQSDSDDGGRDWGIDRSTFGDINNDLDTMHHWLWQTIKTHDLQDAPIIRRGPEGSDYGIDGDIWAHYGLDQAPEPPKEMDINYEFNLLDARPSTRTYATPTGYPQIDTSTESIPGPTSYETYMGLPTDRLISDLYLQHFGREPSEQETQDWQGTGMSASEIETGIVNHPEAEQYLNSYGVESTT